MTWNELPTSILLGILVFLILMSAFFSSSETSMMSINRYKLKHQTKKGYRGAIRTSQLLERTDRLIGLILIGNNFVNIFASVLATIIATRIWGNAGIAIATFGLTVTILIFGEVTPKTLAALYPERIAFPTSIVLWPLLRICYPIVWLLNSICNLLLKLLGIKSLKQRSDSLNADELRTIVHESRLQLSTQRRSMLLGILDLENALVDDILIPRNEVIGIDLDDDIDHILQQLKTSQFTRLPIYREDINNIVGVLHMKKVVKLFCQKEINKSLIMQEACEPYYVPENTPLHKQLFNFQKKKERTALIVDEYGDFLGLVTLEDILEEIVGKFTTDLTDLHQDITQHENGKYIINGSASIRDINRYLQWQLPINQARTLSGLITEYLQEIPSTNVCFKLNQYKFEVLLVNNNRIKKVKVW